MTGTDGSPLGPPPHDSDTPGCASHGWGFVFCVIDHQDFLDYNEAVIAELSLSVSLLSSPPQGETP